MYFLEKQEDMIAFASLEKIGFKRDAIVNDQGLIYQCCDIVVNDSYLSVTNEFDSLGHVSKQTITLNDRELAGKEPTIETLKLIIQIL